MAYEKITQSRGFKKGKTKDFENVVTRAMPCQVPDDQEMASGGHEEFNKMAPHTSANPWGGSEDLG